MTNVRRLFLVGATASFLLSLGSKETAVTFPLALLLWDVLIRRQDAGALRNAFLFRTIFPSGSSCLVRARYGPGSIPAIPSWHSSVWRSVLSLSDHLLSGLPMPSATRLCCSSVHGSKISIMICLCSVHSFNGPCRLRSCVLGTLEPRGWTALGATASASVVRHRVVLFLQLLPTSVIPRTDLLSERNLYLASFGLILSIVVPCRSSPAMAGAGFAAPARRARRHI